MTKAIKLVGLYVLALATVSGCFTLVALGKATWAEVGSLVGAIVLGMAGIHASALLTSTAAPSSPAAPATASGETTAAGVGSAGRSA
jgi:hypothetical protein